MNTKIITSRGEMRRFGLNAKLDGKKLGFVPTMGSLHQGHLSLVRRSKEKGDLTAVSIFVNPTQFGRNEDLDLYPRDFQRDLRMLEELDVDVVFHPSEEEIYPDGFQTSVEVTGITSRLEGEFRPAHFKGVTTVVNILFNIVQPRFAVFGQKDAQQAAVIERMVNDLNMGIEIIVEPTVREADGLAMSSRNVFLSPEERKKATVLYESLIRAEKRIRSGETDAGLLKRDMIGLINKVEGSAVDYVSIVDKKSFEETEAIEEGKEYLILIACRIGGTRLIDNLIIS